MSILNSNIRGVVVNWTNLKGYLKRAPRATMVTNRPIRIVKKTYGLPSEDLTVRLAEIRHELSFLCYRYFFSPLNKIIRNISSETTKEQK